MESKSSSILQKYTIQLAWPASFGQVAYLQVVELPAQSITLGSGKQQTQMIQDMGTSTIDGNKKSKSLDLAAWGISLGILILTPILVGILRTPPAQGPVKDPSVMIIFLSLMALIAVSSLGVYGLWFTKRLNDSNGSNVWNFHAKFLGALFLISGFVKLQDPVGFGYKLDDYWDFFQGYLSFFPNEALKPLSVYIAGFVSVIEVTLAIALMLGWRMRITGTILLLLILFFTFLTGLATSSDKLTDCGCFGDALKLKPFQSFLKDILLTVAILPAFILRKRISPFYHGGLPGYLTLGAFVLPAVVSIYCFLYYPLIDFRGAYVVGQDLKFNSQTIDEEEGQIYAHDFSEFGMECNYDGFQGPTLYIILYNPQKASQKALDEAAALVKELKEKAPGIFVAAGANMSAKKRANLSLNFPADMCWSLQDEKVLKTIVRSSPGFVFLMDGKVVEKWHYNAIPSVEELKQLAGPKANDPMVLPTATPDTLATDSATSDSTR
jgi:uncharacterized membrane protein YphA (DoxX/SURF4 family)